MYKLQAPAVLPPVCSGQNKPTGDEIAGATLFGVSAQG